MTIDHDAIAARVRQDMKAGTPGPWKCGKNNPARVSREGRYIANFDPLHSNAPNCEIDAHRAAHLPDLEAAYLGLYDEVKRLRADLRHVIDERDATFALMLARAEKAEAERDAPRAALDEARSLLVDAMVQLTDGKIKTRRNRALLIHDFLSRDKEPTND